MVYVEGIFKMEDKNCFKNIEVLLENMCKALGRVYV